VEVRPKTNSIEICVQKARWEANMVGIGRRTRMDDNWQCYSRSRWKAYIYILNNV
jgi:diacylglycerol kinase family enzyme